MPKLRFPIGTMEAVSEAELPRGSEWQYEPKWDGFRCVAFKRGKSIELQSKAGKALTRYFPEVVAALASLPVERCILDGELVVPSGSAFSFDALLQRIHPALSRVNRLANETPAHYILFDLLAIGANDIAGLPLSERRRSLEQFFKKSIVGPATEAFFLSPCTDRIPTARAWFKKAGNALDGIIAKRRDRPYEAGATGAVVKVKLKKTADCVVGGYRTSGATNRIASLLLGLYDARGLLHYVGHTVLPKEYESRAFRAELRRATTAPGFTGSAPGGPSRWNGGKEKEWLPLDGTLVVEVEYDQVTGERFRHGTRLVRFRPDKSPRQCTFRQISQKKAAPRELLRNRAAHRRP